MKNPTISFEIRTDRTSNGKHPIVVKLYANRKNKYISTPFKLLPEEWNEAKGRAYDDDRVNEFLIDLNKKFNNFLVERPGATDLEQIAIALFSEFDEKKLQLLQYIAKHIELKVKKNDVIAKTISRYTRVQKVMTDFLTENRNKGMLLSEVNVETINLWDAYIRYNLKVKDKSMDKNTINKYHSVLRTMLIQAVNEGRLKINPYNLFKLKAKPTHRQYLSDEELLKLKNESFESDRNEKVRLIYLFSCYTGIRFEDAQQLGTENLKRNMNGEIYLSFISSKSSKQQEVPIITDAINVIEEMSKRFSDELSVTKKLLPKISNQKFNDYLKAIAIRVGIDKNLTHHTARHTFATYMLNRGVTPPALQVLLGHSNIRETMIYAKITPGYLTNEVRKGNG